MSTPAPPSASNQQTQPPPQTAGLVAVVLGAAATAAAAAAALFPVLAAYGISLRALTATLQVVLSFPPDRAGAAGPATLNAIRLNQVRRAQFVVAASQRLTREVMQASSRGASPDAALQAGIERERRYYGLHIAAMWNRAQAAARVDTAAYQYGQLLGWHTVLDRRTSPECRAANRHNFWAASMPLIGYPGAVHPHCRCYPGRPFRGARLLPSVSPARLAMAA